MFNTKAIENFKQHKLALQRIDELFDANPGTDEANEFEELVNLVQTFEDKHFKIDAPDPVEAAKFRKEQERINVVKSRPENTK